MNSNEEQERIDHLLDLASQGEGAELDPNDMAQLAAGRPERDTRVALEARLAGAAAADTRTVAAVAAATPTRSQQATRRMWWLPVSAAAMVLIAFGAAWLLNRPPTTPAALDDTALAKAFETLRRSAPESFDGIEPILAQERTESEPLIQRGGIRVFVPRGALRDAPPDIQWQPVPGAQVYDVRALSDEGDELFHTTETATRMAWPASATLVPGTSYVVTISTLVSGVRARGSAAFRVLSAQELSQYEAGLRAIDRAEPRALRDILRSQFAIRRGLIKDARTLLAAAKASGLAPDLVKETTDFLVRMHGEP